MKFPVLINHLQPVNTQLTFGEKSNFQENIVKLSHEPPLTVPWHTKQGVCNKSLSVAPIKFLVQTGTKEAILVCCVAAMDRSVRF